MKRHKKLLLNLVFAAVILAAAAALPQEVDPKDIPGRVDLRGTLTFTIDGATAKDFDDAVSLEKTASGWTLGVHIADVSHYVTPGSALDREAYKRGTSVYLLDRCCPKRCPTGSVR